MQDDAEAEDRAVLDRTLLESELDDLNASEPEAVEVTYSTQDYPVDGLVKRLENRSMVVPQFGNSDSAVDTPGFQRGFVWTKAQMDRFVESLLLGYPIPGIFLVRQLKDNRLLVLDGQQRLETLRRFYEGIHEAKQFVLTNVSDQFKGLSYKALGDDLRRKLDDSYMQATIVATDGSHEVDEAVFQIFERLNAGGTQLTAHEIRVALYAGELVASIEALNSDEAWRDIYGRKSKRIRDHELITRILALFERSGEYSRPLKTFLNKYVEDRRAADMKSEDLGTLFLLAASSVKRTGLGLEAFRSSGGSQVNAAQAEAIMVTLMHGLSNGNTFEDNLSERINGLKEDAEFIHATTRATADKEAVEQRLARAHFILIER